jgi:hypothetical protein
VRLRFRLLTVGTNRKAVAACAPEAYGRCCRVSFSKTGKTAYYRGRTFRGGGRAEWLEEGTGEFYWISGCRQDGRDRGGNNPGSFPIEIDGDVRREYWEQIRGQPQRASERVTYG